MRTPPYRGLQTFYVYSKAEAIESDLASVPWRLVQPGEWAETDDGYIAECLFRRTYQNRSGAASELVRLSFGDAWVGPSPLKFRIRLGDKRWGGTSPRSWVEVESRRTRTRNAVEAYLGYVLRGEHVDWFAVGTIYRSDQKDRAASAKRLFRQPKIRKMAAERLRDILSDEGLDARTVLRMMKQTYESAEVNGQTAVMRGVTKDLAELVGLTADAARDMDRERFDAEWDRDGGHTSGEEQTQFWVRPPMPKPLPKGGAIEYVDQ